MTENKRRAAALKDCPTGELTSICSKVSYDTKKEAQEAAVWILHQANYLGEGKKDAKKLRAYQCTRCFKWHLTIRKSVNYLRKRRRIRNG